MAAAILVLQAFATQSCSARCCPQQKASGALISSRPNGVTYALKTKHRVVNVKREHGKTVHAVTCGSGSPACKRACFANALFQNLAVECFAVTQYRTNIFWRVVLAHAAVNTDLFKQVGHPKSARLVSHDRNQAPTQHRVFQQIAQHAHKCHGGTHLFTVRSDCKLGITF